jgi:hypothetical protein
VQQKGDWDHASISPGADVGASAGSIYMRIPDPAPYAKSRVQIRGP